MNEIITGSRPYDDLSDGGVKDAFARGVNNDLSGLAPSEVIMSGCWHGHHLGAAAVLNEFVVTLGHFGCARQCATFYAARTAALCRGQQALLPPSALRYYSLHARRRIPPSP